MEYFETMMLSLEDGEEYSPNYLLNILFALPRFPEGDRKRVLQEVLTLSMTLRSLFISKGGFPGEEWKRVFMYQKTHQA